MVVGRDFVWVHFMKTGGHAVELALRAALKGRPDVTFDARKPPYTGWHHSALQRAAQDPKFSYEDKTVISGFRRLPMWLLSRVHYEASRPPHHCVTREMLCRGDYLENNGDLHRADNYLSDYTSIAGVRWIRHDHLVDDFNSVFGKILGSKAPAAVRKLKTVVNPTATAYVRNLDFYFTPAELAGLYAANPLWAALEKDLYGELITLQAA